MTPEWPTHQDDDLRMVIVEGKGNLSVVSHGFHEVQPAWWRRLYRWLTPWRLHIHVFIDRAPDAQD